MHADGGEFEQSKRDCQSSAVSGLTGATHYISTSPERSCGYRHFLCPGRIGMIPLLAFDPCDRLLKWACLAKILVLLTSVRGWIRMVMVDIVRENTLIHSQKLQFRWQVAATLHFPFECSEVWNECPSDIPGLSSTLAFVQCRTPLESPSDLATALVPRVERRRLAANQELSITDQYLEFLD